MATVAIDGYLNMVKRYDAEIQHMSGDWYAYVGRDHHKDRDCHFGVDAIWSYGNPPKFRAWHEGYVGPRMSVDCDSMLLAMRYVRDYLLDNLRAAYRDAVEQNETPTESRDYWGSDDPQWVLDNLKEYAP